jgi:hypothetical protein
MAVIKDITVDQGATHVEVFTIEVLTDQTLPFDAITNPYIPLDLTTASIQMQVRQTYNSSTVILTATDLNGRIVKTDATHGIITLTIAPADTTAQKFNTPSASFPYDMQIVFTTTNVIKVVSGNFIINREITRIP